MITGNPSTKHGGRLSLRAATEPLPTPLPPPPRANRQPNFLSTDPHVHVVHSVPPEPHFITRFPSIDTTQLQTATPNAEVPERSLLALPVLGSLVVSLILLCGICWYELRRPEGFSWKTIKETVNGLTSRAKPEQELPFITAVPMTPVLAPPDSLEESTPIFPTKAEQVMLSDLVGDEVPSTSEVKHTRW